MIRHVAGAARPPAGAYNADVIILALDRPAETAEAIRSALEQTGVTRHVTILDQGSRPENLDRLAAAVAERTDATVLRTERNLGVAAGRNSAAAFGHGQVIAALDNDAEFSTAATLAELVAVLHTNPDLAAIGCRIVRFETGADDLSSWGYPRSLLPRAAAAFLATTFVGAGHAIRRCAWNEAGGYDPALFFCWEEYDFCLRAIALGWQVQYRGDLAVRHKVSAERRVAWSGTRWFHFVRNRLYIGRKYGAGWLALTPRIIAYLIKGGRNGLLGQTLLAIAAAGRMAAAVPVRTLPPEARIYLRRHDTAHREIWVRRLRADVLTRLHREAGAVAARPTGS